MKQQPVTHRTVISQIGNSQGVRIPKYLLERERMVLSPDAGMPVELISTGEGILIKPMNPKKEVTLEELFAGRVGEPYEMTDALREWEQMPSVGREIL